MSPTNSIKAQTEITKKNNIQEIKSISSSLFHNHMMQHIYALLYVMQKVLALDLEGVHDLKLHHPSSSVATSNQ